MEGLNKQQLEVLHLDDTGNACGAGKEKPALTARIAYNSQNKPIQTKFWQYIYKQSHEMKAELDTM